MENRNLEKYVIKFVVANLIYLTVVEIGFMLVPILEVDVIIASTWRYYLQFLLSAILILFVLMDIRKTKVFLVLLIPTMIFQPVITSIFYIILFLYYNGSFSRSAQHDDLSPQEITP